MSETELLSNPVQCHRTEDRTVGRHLKIPADRQLELQHKIKQLEEELHRKNESVKRHDEEKAFIRSRIDNLLAKLEGVTNS